MRELVDLVAERYIYVWSVDVCRLACGDQQKAHGSYGDYVVLLVVVELGAGLLEELLKVKNDRLVQQGDCGGAERYCYVMALVSLGQRYNHVND